MLSFHETLNRDRCASMMVDLSGAGVDAMFFGHKGMSGWLNFRSFLQHSTTRLTISLTYCCREVTVIPAELYEGFHCISKAPEFFILCCRRSVLENVLACFCNIRGDSVSVNPENASLRYAAYRQYIWWIYKYLGPKNRRTIPPYHHVCFGV